MPQREIRRYAACGGRYEDEVMRGATPPSNPAVTAGCTEKLTTTYNPSGSTTVTEEGSCTVSVSAEGLTIIGHRITEAVTDAANDFVAAVSAIGNAAETFASHFASWLGTAVGGGGYDGDNGDGSGDGGGPGIGDRVLSPSSVTAWSPSTSSAVGSSLSHASPMHFDSIVHTMFVA